MTEHMTVRNERLWKSLEKRATKFAGGRNDIVVIACVKDKDTLQPRFVHWGTTYLKQAVSEQLPAIMESFKTKKLSGTGDQVEALEAVAENSEEPPLLDLRNEQCGLDKMPIEPLRSLVRLSIRITTKQEARWGDEENRWQFWDDDVPYVLSVDPRTPEQKSLQRWTSFLRGTIRRCYQHYGLEHMLSSTTHQRQETAGPSESVPAGPSESVPAGPSESVPAGPSESVPAGPSESVPAGPSESVPAGPSEPVPAESVLARPSESVLADPSESDPAGPSEYVLAGPSESDPAGPSESVPARPSESVLAGPSESARTPESVPAKAVLVGTSETVPAGPSESVPTKKQSRKRTVVRQPSSRKRPTRPARPLEATTEPTPVPAPTLPSEPVTARAPETDLAPPPQTAVVRPPRSRKRPLKLDL